MSKRKMSLNVRLAIAVPLILFAAFNIVRNIDVLFPGDPMESLKSDLEELGSADLEKKEKLMKDIYKGCMELREKSVFAEVPVRKVVEERYNATVNAGKAFGKHDFGILLSGMFAFKAMGPLTKETLLLLESMAANNEAGEIEYSYKSIAAFAVEVSAKNKILEAEKVLASLPEIPRDPLAEDPKQADQTEQDDSAPENAEQ